MKFKDQYKDHVIPSECAGVGEQQDSFLMLDMTDCMFHSLQRKDLDRIIPTDIFDDLKLVDGKRLKEKAIYTHDGELSRYEHIDDSGDLYFAVREYEAERVGWLDPYILDSGKEITYPKYDFHFIRTIGYIKQD